MLASQVTKEQREREPMTHDGPRERKKRETFLYRGQSQEQRLKVEQAIKGFMASMFFYRSSSFSFSPLESPAPAHRACVSHQSSETFLTVVCCTWHTCTCWVIMWPFLASGCFRVLNNSIASTTQDVYTQRDETQHWILPSLMSTRESEGHCRIDDAVIHISFTFWIMCLVVTGRWYTDFKRSNRLTMKFKKGIIKIFWQANTHKQLGTH